MKKNLTFLFPLHNDITDILTDCVIFAIFGAAIFGINEKSG